MSFLKGDILCPQRYNAAMQNDTPELGLSVGYCECYSSTPRAAQGALLSFCILSKVTSKLSVVSRMELR